MGKKSAKANVSPFGSWSPGSQAPYNPICQCLGTDHDWKVIARSPYILLNKHRHTMTNAPHSYANDWTEGGIKMILCGTCNSTRFSFLSFSRGPFIIRLASSSSSRVHSGNKFSTPFFPAIIILLFQISDLSWNKTKLSFWNRDPWAKWETFGRWQAIMFTKKV